jgi:beta-glucosidase
MAAGEAEILPFPPDFLWGAATAAHQVEGGQDNNWSEWEPLVAESLAASAEARLSERVPGWEKIKDDATDPANYISGQAVDHYHRYQEDFDMLAEIGLNSYRFSVEWARIEPRPGKFDDGELGHYKDMVDALRARGIEPIVTLHHFTNPTWLEENGGWHDKNIAEKFGNYSAKVAHALGNKATYYATINEPISYMAQRYLGSELWAGWPDSENNLKHTAKYMRNVADAHAAGYLALKDENPEVQIGFVNNYMDVEVGRHDPATIGFKKLMDYVSHGYWLQKTQDSTDWLGINYYEHGTAKSSLSNPMNWIKEGADGAEKTDWGKSIYPEGLYNVTQNLKKYGKAMIITENGIADADDSKRADYIRSHVREMRRSMEDGANIRGYMYWTLMDNFEWADGHAWKFGLASVDPNTLDRQLRPSAHEYSRIIKKNPDLR